MSPRENAFDTAASESSKDQTNLIDDKRKWAGPEADEGGIFYSMRVDANLLDALQHSQSMRLLAPGWPRLLNLSSTGRINDALTALK
jgi:hypothetical protein